MSGPATAAELVLLRKGNGRPALTFEARTWSWAEVVAEAEQRAAWLAALPPPRHIGVLLDNTPDYVFTLAAAALTGAVVVGLNPTRRGEQLARDIRHTDCQLIVTEGEGLAAVAGLDLGGAEVVAPADLASLGSGAQVPPRPDDLFLLIFTSGSTGRPKAVKVSHRRAAASATGVPFSPDDVLYSAMPLFHGNALFSSLLPAFHAGSRVVLRRRFSASGFLPDIRTHGCTFFNTVGRAIALILATPPTDGDRDHQLKWVLGPETSEADKRAFRRRFGAPVFDGYGSSENAVILHPAGRTAHPNPLGVAPEGTDIAVVDPDTGDERPWARFDDSGVLLNPDECIGEIVGRDAAARFEGYYNDPEAEAERLRQGWYWSGDLAYRDEDGVFYFAGRRGDWLRVDSENFTAAPIETILARAPGVAGAAVYPVPDPRTGDQVMAALEMQEGFTFDPGEFERFLAEQPDLGSKWAPRFVRVCVALPLTATGKLDKKPLRAQGWRTEDPVWWRPLEQRTSAYLPFGPADAAALEAAMADNDRLHLIAVSP